MARKPEEHRFWATLANILPSPLRWVVELLGIPGFGKLGEMQFSEFSSCMASNGQSQHKGGSIVPW